MEIILNKDYQEFVICNNIGQIVHLEFEGPELHCSIYDEDYDLIDGGEFDFSSEERIELFDVFEAAVNNKWLGIEFNKDNYRMATKNEIEYFLEQI